MVFATRQAAASSLAPVTWTSIKQVAPSPSLAIALAKYWQTAVSIPSNFMAASLWGSVMAAVRDRPLARAIRVSLVLVSPSTVIWLKLLLAARLSICCQSWGDTAASQVTKESMVAILGWIIPEPLAIPPIRTGLPSIMVSRAIDLGTKSVVMIDRAASSPPSSLAAAATWGIPALRASIFILCPITPVEARRIVSGSTCNTSPRILALSRVSCQPCSPVAALACPALQRIALALGFAWRRCLQ